MANVVSEAGKKLANKKDKSGKTLMHKASTDLGNYMLIEAILDKYMKGSATARQTQKSLSKFGVGAELRGKAAEIFIYPLEGEGGYYHEM